MVEWGPFHIDLGRELSIASNLLLTLIPSLKEVRTFNNYNNTRASLFAKK